MFCLFALVFEFTGKTGILDDSQFGSSYKLILVHIEHFDFYGSYLQ